MKDLTHAEALIAGIRGLVADPSMSDAKFHGLALRYLAALAVLSAMGNESAVERVKSLVEAGHAIGEVGQSA
jgi:hypothetical protein